MGGGLLQLVAYGAQDVYLTGNPQITFFKVVYRRHTNFAIEAIQQTFNGTPNFGNRVTCQISRNGDLIHRMYLSVVNYYSGANVCPYFGLRLINYVEIEIGGQKIDKHYSHWMYVWNELSLPISKKDASNAQASAPSRSPTFSLRRGRCGLWRIRCSRAKARHFSAAAVSAHRGAGEYPRCTTF